MAPTRCLVLATEVSLFMLLSADGDRSPMPAALTGSVKSWLNSTGTSSASKRAGTNSDWMMLLRMAYFSGSTLITLCR
eukprot:11914989-Ditylum_brightwellii.AAC.1